MRIKVLAPRISNNPARLRVSAYVRVSSTSEELENSLENQVRHYEDYISSRPDWELGKVYSDFGVSGFFENRPGFQEMIQDAHQGKFDLLIVKSISRFARNTETTLKVTRELKQLGIGVNFELQNINTLTSTGEMMMTVLSAFAQAESDGCSSIAKMSVARKFKSGMHHHATKRTYGYEEDDNEKLVIREDEAKVVRQIFDLAANGVWQSKIRELLNKHGIPSPEGKQWVDTTVRRILKNVTYKGDLLLQKTYRDHRRTVRPNTGQADQYYVAANHPCIIQPSQWEDVQQILLNRNAQLNRELPKPPSQTRSSKTRYPLTNLLFCSICGEKLIHKWSNSIREYWVCKTNVKVSAAACKGVWLPASVADSWGISEPVVVVGYLDVNGMKQFTCYLKDEFEAFSA